MIDPNRILNELAKSGIGGGMAGGLLSGALAGALTGGGRGGGGKLLKLGTLAAVGTLAYKAYQTYQKNSAVGAAQPGVPAAAPGFGTVAGAAAATAGIGSAWGAPPPALGESEAMVLLRAMIAAAKADGQIDAAETQAITGQLAQSGLSAEDKAFLFDELAKPLNIEAVIAGVRSPQQAAQVYAASRLVVAEASASEQAYLGLLAARLNLDAAMTRELDQAVKALPG